MSKERQAILHLVAAGRLTAAEAERLLLISGRDRGVYWLAAAGVLMCGAQGAAHALLWSAPRLAHLLFPGVIPGLGTAVTALFAHLGGMR